VRLRHRALQAAVTPDDSSHCSETAFLDCHEELNDDAAGQPEATGSASGGSSSSVTTGVKVYGHHVPPVAGSAKASWTGRPYGQVYCPTVYSDVSSPHALALANDVMSRIILPGEESLVFLRGGAWGIFNCRSAIHVYVRLCIHMGFVGLAKPMLGISQVLHMLMLQVGDPTSHTVKYLGYATCRLGLK
jgi:hypothetical protein